MKIGTLPAVCQEWFDDTGVNFEAVIIVGIDRQYASDGYYGAAWRHVASSRWLIGHGYFRAENLRPHPEPDRVWAEYCAAVLVNEREDNVDSD